MADKIKITKKEIEDLYDVEDSEDSQKKDQEEITVTETFDDYTMRKDKENKWLNDS